jgi:hypothetical protein
VSAEEPQSAGETRARQADSQAEPSEAELRAAYEAELSRLTSADLIAQAVVSLLNVGVRRLGPIGEQPGGGTGAAQDDGAQAGAAGGAGPAPERDLEQVRDSIDAVRALLEILERRVPEGLRPLRDALSQLQMAYARAVQASGGEAGAGAGAAPAGEPQDQPQDQPAGAGGAQQGKAEGAEQQDPSGPGPAESSGRLWVPGR